MLPIVLALIVLVGWGTADIFVTMNSRRLGGYSASFWIYVFGFLFYLLIAWFWIGDLAGLTPQILLINLGTAFVGVIGYMLFVEALRVGNAAVVGTISASYIAITVFISILFLGETINLYQTLAIILILLGIIISAEKFSNLKQGVFNKGSLLALGTMLAWGIYFAYVKIPAEAIGPIWSNFINSSPFILIFIYMWFRGIKLKMPDKKAIGHLAAGSILMNIAYVFYNAAIVIGSVAVVSPIAGSAAVLFAVLAHYVFKDEISRQQIYGVGVTLAGVVALSALSL
ncbi:MAG TPA: DMT family transporter [Candidatus Paceibacterota bacterium]